MESYKILSYSLYQCDYSIMNPRISSHMFDKIVIVGPNTNIGNLGMQMVGTKMTYSTLLPRISSNVLIMRPNKRIETLRYQLGNGWFLIFLRSLCVKEGSGATIFGCYKFPLFLFALIFQILKIQTLNLNVSFS